MWQNRGRLHDINLETIFQWVLMHVYKINSNRKHLFFYEFSNIIKTFTNVFEKKSAKAAKQYTITLHAKCWLRRNFCECQWLGLRCGSNLRARLKSTRAQPKTGQYQRLWYFDPPPCSLWIKETQQGPAPPPRMTHRSIVI